MENPDVVLEFVMENDIVDKDGKKIEKLTMSYKNLSKTKDDGRAGAEFGQICSSLFSYEESEDNNGKED